MTFRSAEAGSQSNRATPIANGPKINIMAKTRPFIVLTRHTKYLVNGRSFHVGNRRS